MQMFKHSPPVVYTHQCRRSFQGKEKEAAVEKQGKSKDKPTQRAGGHESSNKQNKSVVLSCWETDSCYIFQLQITWRPLSTEALVIQLCTSKLITDN